MHTDHEADHYEIFPILLLLSREDQLQLSNTGDRQRSATPRRCKITERDYMTMEILAVSEVRKKKREIANTFGQTYGVRGGAVG
jgi:hypothetical protein